MRTETVRYAITDLNRAVFADDPAPADARQRRWLADLARWSHEGIDFIQLREKALEADELFALAEAGMRSLAGANAASGVVAGRPKLLINHRADIAVAARADGVHLTAHPGELTIRQVRAVFAAAGSGPCVISVSCHNLAEVAAARDGGCDLILFGPIFEKRVGEEVAVPGLGLPALEAAVKIAEGTPLLALGGIGRANIGPCLRGGAAGIAGIRLFT